jgi:hypothetical protein
VHAALKWFNATLFNYTLCNLIVHGFVPVIKADKAPSRFNPAPASLAQAVGGDAQAADSSYLYL